MEPKTHMEALRQSIDAIYELEKDSSIESPQQAVVVLQKWIDKFIKLIKVPSGLSAEKFKVNYGYLALQMGKSALRGWSCWAKEQKRPQCSPAHFYGPMLELSEKKHNDYGNKGLLKFGDFGMITRVGSKVDRLENLIGTGKPVQNEPIDDTWLDIVVYSALMYMWSCDTLKEVW